MEINEFSWKEVSLYHFRLYSIVKSLTYKDLAKWYFSEVLTEKYHKSIILNTEVSSLPNYLHTQRQQFLSRQELPNRVFPCPVSSKEHYGLCFGHQRAHLGHWCCPSGAQCLPKWGTVLTHHGHAACPTGVTCLPIMGNVLAPVGQICSLTSAQ